MAIIGLETVMSFRPEIRGRIRRNHEAARWNAPVGGLAAPPQADI
jgi:hypothetical protein